MIFNFTRLIMIGLGCLMSGIVYGQINNGFNVVSISEAMAISVRVQALDFFEGRYTLADQKTSAFLPGGNSLDMAFATYAVDCREPKKIARIASLFNTQTNPDLAPNWTSVYEKKEYENEFKLNLVNYISVSEFIEKREKESEASFGKKIPKVSPEGPFLVTEYACAVASKIQSPKSISTHLLKTGGSATAKELVCQVKFKDGKEFSWEIVFDEITGFVSLNNIWKLRPYVNSQSVGFFSGDGIDTRINRNNGKLAVTSDKGVNYAMGACEVVIKNQRKF